MNETPQTSVSLILRVANESDMIAWQQFSDIYQPVVYRIGISRGLQAADAHDLVQEVMTRVARSIAKWNPDKDQGTFRGWIGTIARNLVIDFLRKKDRLPITGEQTEIRKLIESKPARSAESDLFDLELEKQMFVAAAKKIKHQFASHTWEAFWHTAVNNQPIETVAGELGLKPGAIYVARSRVMAKLKVTIQQFCEEGDHAKSF